MSRHATIIGVKGKQWSSISVGHANKIRDEFKHGTFAGFDRVHYLDTSGGTNRKRGQKSDPQAKAKEAPKRKG